MVKFTYLIKDVEKNQITEQALNQLGLEGWELILAVPYGTNPIRVYCLFKKMIGYYY